ncbi:MAG: cysteine--tRNA ligase [Balneolales bacterium]
MDQLQIYNTLTREKEEFKPLKEGFVGIYVCGPTVYGDPHLGHAKSYIAFDIVVRYLKYLGYKVRYVQNITDVGHLTDDADEGEDKMLKQSRLERKEPMEIAEKYTYNYFRDMDLLGIQRPDISPRASGHIPEQINMIQKLIDNGHAYEVGGNVYFDVSSLPDYGKLSGREIEASESGTRVESAGDKRNPADFALWKRANPNHLMKWNSPWGEGYPGWHIECSAMSVKYLGETFDIHGGGLENQFPHHECEIAQCEGAGYHPFVRYWMHNNMVTLNGQKMGKSLGNAINIQGFLTGDHPMLSRPWKAEVIRFFLLQSHYGSTTDFSEPALEGAEAGLHSFFEIIKTIRDAEPGTSEKFDLDAFIKGIEARMNDDFNTAKTIGYIFETLKPVRNSISKGAIPENIDELIQFLNTFCKGVLEIWPDEESGVDKQLVNGLVETLLELRSEARQNKDFQTSDNIRDRLTELGITIEDKPEGTTFNF